MFMQHKYMFHIHWGVFPYLNWYPLRKLFSTYSDRSGNAEPVITWEYWLVSAVSSNQTDGLSLICDETQSELNKITKMATFFAKHMHFRV